MKHSVFYLRFFILTLFGLTAQSLVAQNFDWLRTYGAKRTHESFISHCAEKDGGVASLLVHSQDTLGTPQDTLHLDTFQYTREFKSGQGWPCFLVKHDSTGQIVRSRYIGTFGAHQLAIDDSGNYYVSGNIFRDGNIVGSDTVDYRKGALVLAKFDKNFNYLWYKQAGGDSSNCIYKRLRWSLGHLYFVAYLASGSKQIGSQYYADSLGSPDIFGELDPNNGDFMWSQLYYKKKIGNAGHPIRIDDIIRLPNSKIYISGGTGYLDAFIAGDTIHRYSGFVIRSDSVGNYEKSYNFKGKPVVYQSNRFMPWMHNMETDGQNIYCAAHTTDDVYWKGQLVASDFSSSGLHYQGCVISLDADLNEGFFYRPQKVGTKGGTLYDFSFFSMVLAGDALFVFGECSYPLNFDSIVYRDIYDTATNRAGGTFLFRLDTNGKLIYAVAAHPGRDDTLAGYGGYFGWHNTIWGYGNTFVSTQHNALYLGTGFLDSVRFRPYKAQSKGKSDAWLLRIIENKIFRGYISKGPYCAGDTIAIPFTKEGNFDSINYFIAELSNAQGNFDSSVRRLGVVRTFKDSSIRAVLPLTEMESLPDYKIRIRSTWPPVSNAYRDDTLQLLIYSKDKASAGMDIGLCPNDTAILEAKGGTSYAWTPALRVEDSTAKRTRVWPAVTTKYRLVVSDTSGCSPNDTAYKTIEIRHAAIELDSRDTVVCIDNVLHVTGRFTGVDSSKYRWQWWFHEFGYDNLIEIDSGRTSDKLKFLFHFGYDVKLKLFLDNGCKNGGDTAEIKVKMPVPISVNGGAGNIFPCIGEALKLVAKGSGGIQHQYKYRWEDTKDNSLLSDNDTLFIAPKTNGQIRLSLNDACMETGDTQYINISVKQPLAATSTLHDTLICYGEKINFTAGGSGGNSTGYVFSWWLDGKNIFTGNNLDIPSQLYFPDTGVAQKLELIFTDGCTAKADTLSANIMVKPGLQTEINHPDTLCFGEEMVVRSSVKGGEGNYTLQWQNATGQVLSNADTLNIKNGNKSISGLVGYMLISNDGCSVADTNHFQIAFLQALELDIVIADSCIRSADKLTAQPSGGVAQKYSVQWYTNGVYSDTGLSLQIPLPVKETKYTAILHDGCSEHADTATQWVSPYPQMAWAVSPDAGCELLQVLHQGIKQNQTQNQYWYVTGSVNSNWISDTAYAYRYAKGIYTPLVLVRSSLGCTDTFELDTVVVHPKPKAQFYATPTRPTVNSPQVMFVNTSTGAVNYAWDFGTFGSSTAFEPSVPFPSLGSHLVKLIAISDKGCADTIHGEVKVYDDFYIHVPLAFTPNKDGLNDVFVPVITSYKSYTLSIYSRWGELLFRGENTGWDGFYKGSVVPEGRYVYAIDIVTLADVMVMDRGTFIVMKAK